VLGVKIISHDDGGSVAIDFDQCLLRATGETRVKSTSASVAAVDSSRKPVAYINKSGAGSVLYFPFELGTLVSTKTGAARPAFFTDGPTADTEEYAWQPEEFAIGGWLAGQFAAIGLTPSCIAASPGALANLRVAQPFADRHGNLAVIVSTRADIDRRIAPSTEVSLPLPGGPWTHAWWAPAEHDGLQRLDVRAPAGDRHVITLPDIPSAGVLYFFRNHDPLLGIPAIETVNRSIDGHSAKVAPGKPFAVTVQLANPSAAALPAGTLRLRALQGWTVTPAARETPAISPGGTDAFEFTVTPPSDAAELKPDWLYPLVARWSDGRQDRAVITANVEVDIPPGEVTLLLSDNTHYPETYPFRHKTGATYSYTSPSEVADPSRTNAKSPAGPALTNGFDNRTGGRSTTNPSHYATVKTKAAGIIFDLKEPREIRHINIVPGPGDNFPSRLSITSSLDGETFTGRHEETLRPCSAEYRVTLPKIKARFIKIDLEWPQSGGRIAEVEIWGR
jgi:hypothetical protein